MTFAGPFPAGLGACRGKDAVRRYGWLLATVVAALLALVRWCPSSRIASFGVIASSACLTRVPGMVDQLDDPWVGLSGNQRFSTHLYSATRWRILPPLIGHFLHLSRAHYLRVPRIGACWLLLLGTWYAHKLGGVRSAMLAALCFASSTAWLTTVDLIQFDGWAWALLLAAAFTPGRTVTWALTSLGPWIDERFVLFLPLALIIRLAASREMPWREACGIIPYVVVRAAVVNAD